MQKILVTTLGVVVLAAAACSDSSSAPSSGFALTGASAFASTPAGFSELSSSFNATGTEGAFAPDFDRGGRGHGPGGPGFGLGGLMGGGLGGIFFGDGLGREHFGPGPGGNHCAFAAGTGVVCADTTRDGLIASKTIKYTNASGTLQSAFDTATTASVAITSSVSGTATRRDSSTSVVNETSTQTVTGLLTASRTVNGTASGSENTAGKTRDGVSFTAKRTTNDAVTGVVIAKGTSANPFPYPTAGKITRSMSATVTLTGQAATTSTRTETITYDGSATAKVVIVKDGTTQTCTLPLPHGRLSCS
jgi:hypothetical protein